MEKYIGKIGMVEMSCGECGISFAVPKNFYDQCSRLGPQKNWYCPNGHCRHFIKSDDDRLKQAQEEVEWWKRKWEHADDTAEYYKRSAAAYKGNITKIKKRIIHGVCPCCNRHFTNLEHHMKNQHPDYAGELPVPERKQIMG